jgi:hypothetical protein
MFLAIALMLMSANLARLAILARRIRHDDDDDTKGGVAFHSYRSTHLE